MDHQIQQIIYVKNTQHFQKNNIFKNQLKILKKALEIRISRFQDALIFCLINLNFFITWDVRLFSDYNQRMQAQVKQITQASINQFSIEICWNKIVANIVESPRLNPKYSKVSLQHRLALISKVRNGATIINASKSLKINYSTAKSIFQKIKSKKSKKNKRKCNIWTDSSSQGDMIKQQESNST